MDLEQKEKLFSAFLSIHISYGMSAIEEGKSAIVYVSLSSVYDLWKNKIRYGLSGEFKIDGNIVESPLEALEKIDGAGYENFQRSYANSMIIGSMTRFDALITDITRFLILMNPSILSDRQIKVNELFSCSSLNEAVDSAVDKFVYELAYKSLGERLRFINQKFGTHINLSSKTIEAIHKHSATRNSIVHAGGLFTFGSGSEPGEIVANRRDKIEEITWETAKMISDDCNLAADEISNAVSVHIFGQKLP